MVHRLFAMLPRRLRWRVERFLWQRRHGRPYPLVERYLTGLKGIEIGAGAHNHLVDAINIDRSPVPDPIYVEEQTRLAGRAARVDLVALGDDLPFKDRSVDFVVASHVIEHFYDPISALLEWERVARRYVFLIVPHRDRTFDAGRPLTPVDELLGRYGEVTDIFDERHWSVWICETFVELCARIGLNVVETEDPDTRMGNGFSVVIGVDAARPPLAAAFEKTLAQPTADARA